MSCPFCEIPPSRLQAANALAVAICDRYPVNPGHTLVIPRRHVAGWFEATREEQVAILELLDQTRAALEASTPQPDGYNIGVNVGASAGQTIMHLHVHLIPRFAGDVAHPNGGVRHVVPERGRYPWESSS